MCIAGIEEAAAKKVKQCMDNAGSDATLRQECLNRFNDWFPRLSHWTECNAYTAEVSCLTSFISGHCGPDAGPGSGADAGAGPSVSAACCQELNQELTFAKAQKASHCGSTNFVACPF